jgi:uncharacterized Zn-binding protein involved in type VI secretion
MTNVKISEKGRALLKKRASSKVAKAIVREGSRLLNNGSISVEIDGKTITIKGSAAA